jgi:hypothetical protein
MEQRVIVWEPQNKKLDFKILSPEEVLEASLKIMSVLQTRMASRDGISYEAYELAKTIWITMDEVLREHPREDLLVAVTAEEAEEYLKEYAKIQEEYKQLLGDKY